MKFSNENVSVTLQDIVQFSQTLAPYLNLTPLQTCSWLSKGNTGNVLLKREDLQVTNSFTVRAALGIFSRLSDEHFKRGLVFTTPGNLAWGFLYAIQSFNKNINVTIVIPEDAVCEKIQSLKDYNLPNIKIIQKGLREEERYQVVEGIAATEGKLPFFLADRSHEVAAKGTIGLEVFGQLQEFMKVQNKTRLRFVCPIGSGALLTGCSVALKSLMGNDVSIVGVEPEMASDFFQLYYNKNIDSMDCNSTIADSLRSPMVRKEYKEILLSNVDQVITVSENEILEAMSLTKYHSGFRIEPSAATVISAVRKCNADDTDSFTVCLISAGNVDRKKFSYLDADITLPLLFLS